jgi:hypothetical protein
MVYTNRVAMVIPTGVKKNGSDVFNILDPDSGGAATFSVPLSVDGAAPATYWAAYSPLLQSAFDALTQMSTVDFKTYIDSEAARLGRTPAGSITAFKTSLQMSAPGADFYAFIASIGLKRVVA